MGTKIAIPEPDRDRTEAEVLRIARRLSFLRSLAPYPRHLQQIDWMHRSLASYTREAIWTFFNQRNRSVPFAVRWHDGLTLTLNLGDELSRFVFVEGCYDANEFAFLHSALQPGMNFMDIGANAGVYTLFAARRVGPAGQVWSVEPSSRERAALDRNIRRNSLKNVNVLALAVAESDGEAKLQIAGTGRSGRNTLGKTVGDGLRVLASEAVPLKTLDRLAEEIPIKRLDVLKVDAEGAELKIVRGAARVLRDLRPTLLFEAQDSSLKEQGGSLGELLSAVRAHGYIVSGFDPDTGLPTADPGADDLNLLAVPMERVI